MVKSRGRTLFQTGRYQFSTNFVSCRIKWVESVSMLTKTMLLSMPSPIVEFYSKEFHWESTAVKNKSSYFLLFIARQLQSGFIFEFNKKLFQVSRFFQKPFIINDWRWEQKYVTPHCCERELIFLLTTSGLINAVQHF